MMSSTMQLEALLLAGLTLPAHARTRSIFYDAVSIRAPTTSVASHRFYGSAEEADLHRSAVQIHAAVESAGEEARTGGFLPGILASALSFEIVERRDWMNESPPDFYSARVLTLLEEGRADDEIAAIVWYPLAVTGDERSGLWHINEKPTQSRSVFHATVRWRLAIFAAHSPKGILAQAKLSLP